MRLQTVRACRPSNRPLVKAGVVTLGGAVDQKSLKSRAEKVARKVKGVKQVVNNIEIKTRASSK